MKCWDTLRSEDTLRCGSSHLIFFSPFSIFYIITPLITSSRFQVFYVSGNLLCKVGYLLSARVDVLRSNTRAAKAAFPRVLSQYRMQYSCKLRHLLNLAIQFIRISWLESRNVIEMTRVRLVIVFTREA